MSTKAIFLATVLAAGAIGNARGLSAATNDVVGDEDEYEYLAPETGILFEPGLSYFYQETLLALLLAGSDINRGCQMVIEENVWGSERELAVFIEKDRQTSRWMVVRRSAKRSIGRAVSEALFDKNRPQGGDYRPYLKVGPADVADRRAALSEGTAEAMLQACEMMLGMVRYPPKTTLLLHPAIVHFAHHDVNHGYRAGRTVFNRGRVGRFRNMLEQLGEVAIASAGTRPSAEKRVKDAAVALVGELSTVGVAIPDIKAEIRQAPPLDPPQVTKP